MNSLVKEGVDFLCFNTLNRQLLNENETYFHNKTDNATFTNITGSTRLLLYYCYQHPQTPLHFAFHDSQLTSGGASGPPRPPLPPASRTCPSQDDGKVTNLVNVSDDKATPNTVEYMQ